MSSLFCVFIKALFLSDREQCFYKYIIERSDVRWKMKHGNKMYKEILIKDNLFQTLKQEILNDPASRVTLDIIKSYDVEEDMAILMLIEIAQTQDEMDNDNLRGLL